MEDVATFSLQVVPAEISLQRILIRAPARISVSLRFLRYPALHVSDAQLGDDAQTRNAGATTLVLGLGKGKSCLFQEQPTRLSEQLMREPLFFIVEAVRDKRNGSNAGTSSSSLVATGALPLRWTGGGAGHFVEGRVTLLTPMGSVAGHMKLVAHLRCHGHAMAQHINETVARAQAEAARGGNRQRQEEESDSGRGDGNGDARTQVATHSLAANLEERIAQRRRKEESWWEKEERKTRSRPVPQRRPGPPMLFYANDGEDDSEDEEEQHIDCDGERIEHLEMDVVSPARTVVVSSQQHERGNAAASIHGAKDEEEDEGRRVQIQSSDEEHTVSLPSAGVGTATKLLSSSILASETKECLPEKDEKMVRDDEEKEGTPLRSAHVSRTSISAGSDSIDKDAHRTNDDDMYQDQQETPQLDVYKHVQPHLQRSFAFARDEGERPSSSDTGGAAAEPHVEAVGAAESSDSSRAFLDSSGHIDSVTSSRDDFASPDATVMLSEVYSPDADHYV